MKTDRSTHSKDIFIYSHNIMKDWNVKSRAQKNKFTIYANSEKNEFNQQFSFSPWGCRLGTNEGIMAQQFMLTSILPKCNIFLSSNSKYTYLLNYESSSKQRVQNRFSRRRNEVQAVPAELKWYPFGANLWPKNPKLVAIGFEVRKRLTSFSFCSQNAIGNLWVVIAQTQRVWYFVTHRASYQISILLLPTAVYFTCQADKYTTCLHCKWLGE